MFAPANYNLLRWAGTDAILSPLKQSEVDSLDPELDAEEIALLVADIEALENI